MPNADRLIIANPDRLAGLQRLRLLDTPADPAFDRLTRLASRILHGPISAVSLIDVQRQFFKSQVGLGELWASRREIGQPVRFRASDPAHRTGTALTRPSPRLLNQSLGILEIGDRADALANAALKRGLEHRRQALDQHIARDHDQQITIGWVGRQNVARVHNHAAHRNRTRLSVINYEMNGVRCAAHQFDNFLIDDVQFFPRPAIVEG